VNAHTAFEIASHYVRLRGKETSYTAFALDDDGKIAYLEPFEE
jgi:hypothetical protein